MDIVALKSGSGYVIHIVSNIRKLAVVDIEIYKSNAFNLGGINIKVCKNEK